jgi:hypothetical protein
MYDPKDVAQTNSKVKLDHPVSTRKVRSKSDGSIVIVDDRFNPELYEEIEVPAGDEKPVA